MSKEKHTPMTPWYSVGGSRCTIDIFDVRGNWIMALGDFDTAAFVIQACNSHAALLAALDLITEQYEQICQDNHVMGFPGAVKIARATIALAEGKL